MYQHLTIAPQLLACNPFIQVLLESMVVERVTIENEYVSLLFSIDDLQHPLLHGVPFQHNRATNAYEISTAEFLNLRLPILDGQFAAVIRPVFTTETGISVKRCSGT